jgi:hypothetical protein
MTPTRGMGFVLALALCVATARAQERVQPKGDVIKDVHRYTAPDPSSSGGLRGRIVNPSSYIFGVYALCPNEPRWVYRAEFTSEDRKDFVFTGLPMEKYDLMVVFLDAVYEGLQLEGAKEGSSLTTKDKQGIETIIRKTEPFYDQKFIFRESGIAGKGQKAQALCAFVRTKQSEDYGGVKFTDHRRSIKLIHLLNVGPGWQVASTREIYVTFVKPGTGADIRNVYRPWLGGIRVTDKIKDLGEIDLSRAEGL